MSGKRLAPVTGQVTWKRDDLERDDSWILQVTDAQAAEIAAADAVVAARGLRGAEFAAGDFPLPLFAPVLAEALAEVEHGRGVVVLRGLPVDRHDEEKAARILWGLGLHFGRPLRQSSRTNLAGYRDDLIAHIIDQGLDYGAPNVNGSATSAEQMPHCDGSDLVALLCLRPAADGGGISHVVSSMAIYNELLAHHPEALDTLYEGFVHDLRRQAGDEAQLVTPRIPVYSDFEGVLSCNFNSKTVQQGAAKLGRPLDAAEQHALDTMLRIATSPAFSFDMRLRTGDLQLANNYTVLHCRTAWQDPPDRREARLMMRLWLRCAVPRPVAPLVLGGYLTGAVHDTAAQLRGS